MEIERIKLLGVPVDICRPADFEEAIVSLMEKEGPKQIVFLSIWDLLKARGKSEFAKAVQQADLMDIQKHHKRGALPQADGPDPLESV